MMPDGGRKKTRSSVAKTAAFAPMPRANVTMIAAVIPGARASARTAYVKSCRKASAARRAILKDAPMLRAFRTDKDGECENRLPNANYTGKRTVVYSVVTCIA